MSVTQWLHNAAFALALSTGMPVLPPESWWYGALPLRPLT